MAGEADAGPPVLDRLSCLNYVGPRRSKAATGQAGRADDEGARSRELGGVMELAALKIGRIDTT